MDTLLGKPELHGQVAVVTGAGGGIGAAIAQRLARMGALTFLLGRRKTALEGIAEAISKAGGQAEAWSSAKRDGSTSW
jgi:NADP-dependent 3-hydroxy acid dehydrogenase YdfG